MPHLHPTHCTLRHSFQSWPVVYWLCTTDRLCRSSWQLSLTFSHRFLNFFVPLFFIRSLLWAVSSTEDVVTLYTHSHLPALPLCVSSWGSTGNSNRHSLALHSTSSPKAHSTYSSLKGFSVNIISCYQTEKSCKVMFDIVLAEPIQVKKQELCFFVVRKGAPQHL